MGEPFGSSTALGLKPCLVFTRSLRAIPSFGFSSEFTQLKLKFDHLPQLPSFAPEYHTYTAGRVAHRAIFATSSACAAPRKCPFCASTYFSRTLDSLAHAEYKKHSSRTLRIPFNQFISPQGY
jgi:hypothetical protein